MAQKLDVVNLALSALTQNPVTDLTEATLQGSTAARKVLAQLEQARDSILERHSWLCALRRVQLDPATIPNYSDWKLPNAYKLPGDCLSVWSVQVAAPCSPPDGWAADMDPMDWTPTWELGTVDTDGDEATGTGADAMSTLIIRSTVSTTLNVELICRVGWPSLSPLLADAIGYEAGRRTGRSVTSNAGVLNDVKADAANSLALAMGQEATQEGGKPPLILSTFRALRNSTM